MTGVVQRRDTGRPELVYGRWCRPSELEHEVRVTDFALLFPGCLFTRGVRAGRAVADGLLVRDGRRCYVEIDNSGKMTARQMEAKWRRYGTMVDGFILVVCLSEGRMERLRRGAGPVRDFALFTTFERLRTGRPWIDWYGQTATV